jgi:hypothetical protein
MTKKEWREQQRKLPFEEKLRILEDLRRSPSPNEAGPKQIRLPHNLA